MREEGGRRRDDGARSEGEGRGKSEEGGGEETGGVCDEGGEKMFVRMEMRKRERSERRDGVRRGERRPKHVHAFLRRVSCLIVIFLRRYFGNSDLRNGLLKVWR